MGTRHDDREFRLPGDQGEQKHRDLLTALMHELGHVLGLDHEQNTGARCAVVAGGPETPWQAGGLLPR